MPKTNPFRPGSPVSPGMFVGRVAEIRRLQAHLLQTRADRPSNFMVTGERGIGKSSLLLYAQYIARGRLPLDGVTPNFLVIYTDVNQNTTQLGLIRRIERDLRRGLAETERARELWDKTWKFLRQLEGGGFKLGCESETDTDELVLDEFASTLAQVCERICRPEEEGALLSSCYEGIMVLIDEADNSSPQLGLGSFLKLLAERLQRENCLRVMFGLAGLPTLPNILLDSHPSSLRLVEEIPLERLTASEVKQVVHMCLSLANEQNTIQTRITPEGEHMLALLSEGYPHFIQQFGYSAFEADDDDSIDADDVKRGAFTRRGALELIGESYYRNDFYNKIKNENYRQVLRIMADGLDDWITKIEIRSKFTGNESTLSNALRALRTRGIILSREGVKGVYRLQQKGFALWIKLYTTDSREMQASLSEAVVNGDGP